MKKLLLLLTLCFALVSSSVFAAAQSGTAVRIVYSSASVGTNTWTPVVASTVKAVKGLTFYNSATSPIKIGIANAGAAAETEVVQMEVPGVLAKFAPPVAVYYPLVASQSVRISLKADESAATVGEGIMNLIYN